MTNTEILTGTDLIAFCLADSAEIAAGTVIEVGDTVRYIGKTQHWTVTAVAGDLLTVVTGWGNVRRHTEIIRPVLLNRVELVRKGNDLDDAIAAALAG